MKKFYFINKLLLITTSLFVISCKGVFIIDPVDPRLPMYTETGNNVAGAFVDEKIWKSVVRHPMPNPTVNVPSILYYSQKDSLILTFYGEISDSEHIDIEFTFTGLGIDTFEKLILLANRKIELNGTKMKATLKPSFTSQHGGTGVGQIYFKNVKTHGATTFLLSGTFGFLVNNAAVKYSDVSYGRFDYTLSNTKFVVE